MSKIRYGEEVMDGITVAAIVGSVVAMAKVVEKMAEHLIKKTKTVNGSCHVTRDEHQNAVRELDHKLDETKVLCEKLLEMHSVRDSDGIYNWWVPRQWGTILDKIAGAITENATTNQRVADIMERMDRRLEKMEERLK